MNPRLRGVIAPVLTPFSDDLKPDVERFVSHCQWLLRNNASLAIFGTNSEAASISVSERKSLSEALLLAGVPPSAMMPGVGACALPDAVELARHASAMGVAGLLIVPPYFFKNVPEDGLFAYYAEIIERVGTPCSPIYLYHIPQLSGVPISLQLIERLMKRYPTVVAGAKDSSGDWENTRSMIEQFGGDGFDVFPASEAFLSAAMQLGASGCISATVNVNPLKIHRLYERWNESDGPRLQAEADRIRKVFQGYSMIPAMKYVLAAYTKGKEWSLVRPPLTRISEEAGEDVLAVLRQLDFEFPAIS